MKKTVKVDIIRFSSSFFSISLFLFLIFFSFFYFSLDYFQYAVSSFVLVLLTNGILLIIAEFLEDLTLAFLLYCLYFWCEFFSLISLRTMQSLKYFPRYSTFFIFLICSFSPHSVNFLFFKTKLVHKWRKRIAAFKWQSGIVHRFQVPTLFVAATWCFVADRIFFHFNEKQKDFCDLWYSHMMYEGDVMQKVAWKSEFIPKLTIF